MVKKAVSKKIVPGKAAAKAPVTKNATGGTPIEGKMVAAKLAGKTLALEQLKKMKVDVETLIVKRVSASKWSLESLVSAKPATKKVAVKKAAVKVTAKKVAAKSPAKKSLSEKSLRTSAESCFP